MLKYILSIFLLCLIPLVSAKVYDVNISIVTTSVNITLDGMGIEILNRTGNPTMNKNFFVIDKDTKVIAIDSSAININQYFKSRRIQIDKQYANISIDGGAYKVYNLSDVAKYCDNANSTKCLIKDAYIKTWVSDGIIARITFAGCEENKLYELRKISSFTSDNFAISLNGEYAGFTYCKNNKLQFDVSSFSSYGAAPGSLDTAILHYYKCDGNTNDAVYTYSSNLTSGYSASAAGIIGGYCKSNTTAYLTGDNAKRHINYTSGNGTMNMWFRNISATGDNAWNGGLFYNGATASNHYMQFRSNSTHIYPYRAREGIAGEGPPIQVRYASNASWQMLTVIWCNASNQGSMYLNATLVTNWSCTPGNGAYAAPALYAFGRQTKNAAATISNMVVDEIGEWERNLEPDEITALYGSGAPTIQYPFLVPVYIPITQSSPVANTTYTTQPLFNCTAGNATRVNIQAWNRATTSERLNAYYDFEETSGTVAKDLALVSNGTLTGVTVNVTGNFSSAYNFTLGSYVSLASHSNLDVGPNFSVSAWIKPGTLTDYGGIVSRNSATRTAPWTWMLTIMANGGLAAYTSSGNDTWYYSPNASLQVGKWTMVTWVTDNTTMWYYSNGVLIGNTSYRHFRNSSSITRIGSWYSINTLYDFNGTIDDVAIYSRVLTTGEVRKMFDDGVAGKGLITRYSNSSGVNGAYTYTDSLNDGDISTRCVARDASDNLNYSDIRIFTMQQPCSTTGGYVYKSGNYTIHKFLSSGTFSVTNGCPYRNYEVLVVAGGGSGGDMTGGGGGAGGLLYTSSYGISPGSYTVTVGMGGNATTPAAGTNSTFSTLNAKGGGQGGSNGVNGGAGGSGGAGGHSGTTGGLGLAGQGNAGGNGSTTAPNYGAAGGGGAGGVGQNSTNTAGGNGGAGLLYTITGTPQYYAGGGGGGAYLTANMGTGGSGVGGAGGGFNAVQSTGSGGGGQKDNILWNSNGSNGIVVIRYLNPSDTCINFTDIPINPIINTTLNTLETNTSVILNSTLVYKERPSSVSLTKSGHTGSGTVRFDFPPESNYLMQNKSMHFLLYIKNAQVIGNISYVQMFLHDAPYSNYFSGTLLPAQMTSGVWMDFVMASKDMGVVGSPNSTLLTGARIDITTIATTTIINNGDFHVGYIYTNDVSSNTINSSNKCTVAYPLNLGNSTKTFIGADILQVNNNITNFGILRLTGTTTVMLNQSGFSKTNALMKP